MRLLVVVLSWAAVQRSIPASAQLKHFTGFLGAAEAAALVLHAGVVILLELFLSAYLCPGGRRKQGTRVAQRTNDYLRSTLLLSFQGQEPVLLVFV